MADKSYNIRLNIVADRASKEMSRPHKFRER
jgi:hypothetical protein